MRSSFEIEVHLAGPVRVLRHDGVDLTPRAAKAQGLLVLLGTTPGLRRSRAWLQDKLWSDRSPEQGSASLRQTLVELRRALGNSRHCLVTDAGWIGLDSERVRVQIDTVDRGLAGDPMEFAEGLDIGDPEFQDWIRDRRLAFAERSDADARSRPLVAGSGVPPLPGEGQAPAPAMPEGAASAGPHGSFARAWDRFRTLPPSAIAGLLILLLSVFAAVAWLPPGPQWPEAAAIHEQQANAAPSIAVLRFDSLGGGPKQEMFVDGVTRDIITDLSKFGSLFVLAADSSFRVADRSTPPRVADPALAVRYVLSGSVQWLDDQVRVNAQLVETETNRIVWTERFDRPANDILKLQNEIAQRVVDIIGPVTAAQGRLRKVELDRLARIPTESLQAYDHYLQGVVQYEQFTPEGSLQARESFARATALDPGYAKAYAMATWTYLTDVWDGRTDDPADALARAEALAERAVDVDPGEPYAHWALGAVRLFQRRHDLSIASYRRAVELNPNGADLLVYLGWALAYTGKPDEGLVFMERAIERNPYHPGWYLYDLAFGHFVAHRYQEAVATLERRTPKSTGTYELLALSYAMLGRDADAKAAMARVLEARPNYSVDLIAKLEPFAHEADLQHYLAALSSAGAPEHADGPD